MKTKVILLAILLIFSSTIVLAETSVLVGVHTHHFNGDKSLNENNQGIGISTDRFIGMTFVNSNDKRSWFLGGALRTDKLGLGRDFYARGNFYVGALYGYGDYMPNVAGWTVGATPSIEVGYGRVALETMVAPVGGGVVSTALKISF